MRTLCELFHERAEAAPSRIALHCKGQDVTYGQLACQAAAIAAWLEREGIKRGDRVVMLLGNSAEYVACYLGILRAGGVVVALNPDTTARELSRTLADADPVGVVVGSKAVAPLVAWARQLGEASGASNIRLVIHVGEVSSTSLPAEWHAVTLADVLRTPAAPSCAGPSVDDLAQLIYTSGTTSRPKGVMLTHRNIAANCRSILQYLGLTADDSVFVILPFFYSYGNSLLFTHLAVGGRLILASDFVFWNRALDLMVAERATGFSGVPSSYAMLLHKSDLRKRDFPDLRYMTCAGGGLAPAVVQQLREIVPHAALFLMYGQTEATARLSNLMPEELDAKLGSIGRGIPGVTLQVLDKQGRPVPPGQVGEIIARGENIMAGYWQDPLETANVLENGDLRTGDLARVDEEGYIYFVSRKTDIIKSGAYRLNPKEIEDVILELDGVAEVAVAGLPDDIWGEIPVAFVVPSPTQAVPTQREILKHCRRHLPRYKLVHAVRFVDCLPKTSSGKIRRTELRDTWHTTFVSTDR
ncbi:MAG: class I adenylate-forming enzyme family protein [Planctomycetota bacterium]